jgi:hypothetical protein
MYGRSFRMCSFINNNKCNDGCVCLSQLSLSSMQCNVMNNNASLLDPMIDRSMDGWILA